MKDLYTKIIFQNFDEETFGKDSWANKSFKQDVFELESILQTFYLKWGVKIDISVNKDFEKNKVVSRGIAKIINDNL